MKGCTHEHAKDGKCVAPHCAYYQIHKEKCPYMTQDSQQLRKGETNE